MGRTIRDLIVGLLVRAGATLFLVGAGIAILSYGFSIFWPVYDWAGRLGSPDGRFELVVLRGDKAAFDDFFYDVYVFSRAKVPETKAKGARVWMIGRWRSDRYLIYSGYGYPMLRWTGPHSLEIDLTDVQPEVSEFHPVKDFGRSETVITSLIFGKSDPRNFAP